MKHAGLKPCAECGGAGELRQELRGDEFLHFVVCRDCGTRTLNHKSVARAVKGWNDWNTQSTKEDLK